MTFDSIVRDELDAHPDVTTTVVHEPVWHQVAPSRARTRVQGWKIHVSAVPADAEDVLARVAALLVPREVAFKYLASAEVLDESLKRRSDPSSSGKFITVYPKDDDEFVALVKELHDLLAGCRGPRILSDRQYRDGVVHYRYGQIKRHSVLDDLGTHRHVIVAPDGSLASDERRSWYTQPEWVRDPFAEPEFAAPGEATRLTDRYRVTSVIRHNNRGGVFHAEDVSTGRPVIVKHCRAGIDPNPDGTDTRDTMRHEAAMLREFAGIVPVPELIDLFDVGEHTFLVEEKLPGVPLHSLLSPDDDDAPPPDPDVVLDLVRQITTLLDTVHRHGFVVGDVSPDNFLLAPSGILHLLDLEGAGRIGEPAAVVRTMEYAAPEKLAQTRESPGVADAATDRYGGGAVIEALAQARQRDGHSRAPFDVLAAHNSLAAELAPVVRGLTQAVPVDRWTWDRVHGELAKPRSSPIAAVGRESPVQDCLKGLLNALRPGDESMVESTRRYDSRFVQTGAAGATSVLVQALRAAEHMPPELATVSREVSRWWHGTLDRFENRLLPGLYNGHSGACWAAADIARATGDESTLDRALDVAGKLPVRWHIPTVAHGVAGSGMTMLHLWRTTGLSAFRDKALDCAEHLTRCATPMATGGVHWPAGDGSSYHGFAVGTAGIGAFLAEVADLCDEDGPRRVARQAGDELLSQARMRDVRIIERDGSSATHRAAWWSEGPTSQCVRHGWWSGGAGIGAFLWRLGNRDMALAAAAGVRQSSVRAPLGAFWGLAGDGAFLLEVAETETPVRPWADFVTALVESHALQDQGHDFATGTTGTLAYLLRARHGCPMPWTSPDFS
ncbi:hypothetical protein ALI144C_17000 [Actinosynnema sp. ALI-1.44]|uniref:class III lanthionine synthetase LanKC N-terminal domain-containing protein n=1 Tax=Actinosynnema sp. ALI-1.44 TaxID=1933779 RepID=UPI00097C5605|nr:lanthionine synthetase LanC family protein [Actinosynnema sp. ALI-1.44]ONI83194.1 hypothetical protein ALI144C_17000 [Actinosynnema sp. ALI-1.44]